MCAVESTPAHLYSAHVLYPLPRVVVTWDSVDLMRFYPYPMRQGKEKKTKKQGMSFRGEILRGHDAPLVPCLFPNRLLFSHLGQNLGWKIDSHGSLVSVVYSPSLSCVFFFFLFLSCTIVFVSFLYSRASIINTTVGTAFFPPHISPKRSCV